MREQPHHQHVRHPHIPPTVGRIVLYAPQPGTDLFKDVDSNHDARLAAKIAWVNDNGTVNLTVSGRYGDVHAVRNVTLLQQGDNMARGREFCHWMAYQVGQAARTEHAEGELARARSGPVAGAGGSGGDSFARPGDPVPAPHGGSLAGDPAPTPEKAASDTQGA